MPQNQFQRMMFALLTVVITVHAFVFYNLYVVNGDHLRAATGASSLFGAIEAQGGVYMMAHYVPVWLVVMVEFVFAYTLEVVVGQPLSFSIASRMLDPTSTSPALFETAIIASTVFFMCPSMSLIASFLYYPYYEGFSVVHLMGVWFRTVCYNLPFAFFSQLLFIQPLVRQMFRVLFVKKA